MEEVKRLLSVDDYAFILGAIEEFICYLRKQTAGQWFNSTYHEVFMRNSLFSILVMDFFEGFCPRDMVRFRFPQSLPSRKRWPYKTSRKDFMAFIEKISQSENGHLYE